MRIDLIDEDTGIKLGTSYTSLYSLLMRDADVNESDWKRAVEEKYFLRESDISDKGLYIFSPFLLIPLLPTPFPHSLLLHQRSGRSRHRKSTV